MKKIKLMLVLLACFFGSLVGSTAWASKTFYAVANAPWNRILAYCYKGGDNQGWPKDNAADNHVTRMTATSWTYDGKTVYKYTVEDKYDGTLILHQGYDGDANQSYDISPIKDGVLYVVANNGNNSKRNITTIENYGAPTKLYFFGNINGTDNWTGDKTLTGIDRTGENTFVWNVNFTQESWFRLYNDNTKKQISNVDGSGNLEFKEGDFNTKYGADDGTFHVYGDNLGAYEITVTYTPQNIYKLSVKKSGGTPTPAELPSTITFTGYQQGWSNPTSFSLSKNSSDQYIGTVNIEGNIFYCWFEADGTQYGSDTHMNVNNGGKDVAENTTYTTDKSHSSDYRFKMPKGKYDVTAWFDNGNIKFKYVTHTEQVVLPDAISINGYYEGAGTKKTEFTLNKNAQDKYVKVVTLTNKYYFWFESDNVNYASNTTGAGEGLTAGTTEHTTQNNGTNEAKRYNIAAGTYTVTAWWSNDVLKFTIAPYTTNIPTLTLKGYKPGKGTVFTFATTEIDEDNEMYHFTLNVDEDNYKFWFETSDHRYTPNKDNGNEDVTAGVRDMLTREKAKTYNEQQFYAERGTYEGTAWWDNGKLYFSIAKHVVSASSRTLYMHFCQNYHKGNTRSKKPLIQLWTSTSHTTNPGKQVEMTKVTGYGLTSNDDLYKYELTEDEFNTYHDATFMAPEGNAYQLYRCGTSLDWDGDNWTKYMYGPGAGGAAAQSYITFDEYKAIREENPQTIYLTGKGFKKFTAAGNWTVTSDDLLSADATMGVFYPKFEFDDAQLNTMTFSGKSYSGAAFKMSWLHPYKYWALHYDSSRAINDNRCWATFNMGIIGYDKERVEGSTTLNSALNPKLNGENVLFEEGKTMPQNNYNQYNWFLAKASSQQTLVVDLDGDCQSVTMLPFEPNPTISAEAPQYQTVAFGYTRAGQYYTPSAFKAEDANGAVLFGHVNVASAVADISAVSKSNLTNFHYDVDYEIYSNRMQVGQTFDGDKINGDNVRVMLESIAIGSGAKLGIRALFRDTQTGLHFHSKYNEADVVSNLTLNAPTFEIDTKTKTYTDGSNFLYDGEGDNLTLIKDPARDPRYTLGAKAEMVVTAPANTVKLAWYGDFNAKVSDDDLAVSHHSDHQWHANGGEIQLSTAHTKWEQPSFSGYSDDEIQDGVNHNWAKTLGEVDVNALTTRWPVHLPEVVEVHRTYADNGYEFTETGLPSRMTIDMQVGAVYPFLIDRDAEIQVYNERTYALNAPRRAYSVVEDHNYTIVPVAVYADYMPYTLSADSDLTGVSEAFLGAAAGAGFDENAPIEYYNLQGMRVGGDLAPGIYIRRQGNKVEKMIIR